MNPSYLQDDYYLQEIEDLQNLQKICLIIDLDGFRIGNHKEFLVREIGYASITKDQVNSVRFNLTDYFKNLTPADFATINYCRKFIHGLSFRPLPGEKDAIHIKNLNKVIWTIYVNNKTFDKNVIAYKGGHIEKDILNDLEIPSMNLEEYGCPKFEQLPTPTINECGFHDKKNKVHCPKVECAAFYEWLKERIPKK